MSAVESRPHCNVKPRTVRALPPGLPANRLQLIRMLASKVRVTGDARSCSDSGRRRKSALESQQPSLG